MKFELATLGDQDVILLNGSIMSMAEILPFLHEFSRQYEENMEAQMPLELGSQYAALPDSADS